ncbi:caspase family protein [Crinalium epipsammum]|nr:caspase family protein [Crinalium epipsammum]
MGLKRRTFLQQAGLALLALELSDAALAVMGQSLAKPLFDRYYQALAEPTTRKLALLVGINQYPRSGETRNVVPLQGCVTDVELQRELLIHRFGFQASDILTLTDQQATRENIETAFLEHLSNQAKPDDVVLFHFSGYGSRVNLNSEVQSGEPLISTLKSQIQNALVAVDGMQPTQGNYLLEETLFLLLRSLTTDQVTTVLDTSYTLPDSPLQGNLRIRTHPAVYSQQPTEELDFQSQLLLRLNTTRQQLEGQLNFNQMPGILLNASSANQPAMEVTWGEFSAGLFTSALTQYLWQATPQTTIKVSLSRATEAINQLVGKQQQPQINGSKSQEDYLLAYNLIPENIGADGVVIAVEDSGKIAQLWLGGLPLKVLANYGVNSVFSVVSSEDNVDIPADSTSATGITKPLQLQIRGREALTAKARLISLDISDRQLQIGQLVQESLRVLPRNLGLTVAIDASLERIERVDATSAFGNLKSVTSVIKAGEQPADYIFSKVASTDSTQQVEEAIIRDNSNLANANNESASTSLIVPTSEAKYGLFSLANTTVPNTLGVASETVKAAVNRLKPKLKTLLAAKLWRLTVNEGSSRLGVAASLEMLAPEAKVLIERSTIRAGISKQQAGVNHQTNIIDSSTLGMVTVANGSRICYRVHNYSDRTLYFMLVGLDSSSNAIALSLLKDTFIPAGQTLSIPQSTSSFEWLIHEATGLTETFLICSIAPFPQAKAALEAAIINTEERIEKLVNPLDVTIAILQDLHQASALVQRQEIVSLAAETSSTSSDSYALDVQAWATLSFVYQVS